MIIKISPPRPSLSKQRQLYELRKQFKNPEMVAAFGELQKRYKHFRNIRGDGNCFVRAVGYSHLLTRKLFKAKQVFQHIDKIDLMKIKRDTIPSDFLSIFTKEGIKLAIQEYWDQTFSKYYATSEIVADSLTQMFNQHWLFDFLIIIYLRALCIHQYLKNKSDYEMFEQGDEMEVMSCFGRQSEGLMVRVMADALKSNIVINQIDKKDGYSQMVYQYDSKYNLAILFKPGHYDLLESPTGSPIENMHNFSMVQNSNCRTTFAIIKVVTGSNPQSNKNKQLENYNNLKYNNGLINENQHNKVSISQQNIQLIPAKKSSFEKKEQEVTRTESKAAPNSFENRQNDQIKAADNGCQSCTAMRQIFNNVIQNCFECGWKKHWKTASKKYDQERADEKMKENFKKKYTQIQRQNFKNGTEALKSEVNTVKTKKISILTQQPVDNKRPKYETDMIINKTSNSDLEDSKTFDKCQNSKAHQIDSQINEDDDKSLSNNHTTTTKDKKMGQEYVRTMKVQTKIVNNNLQKKNKTKEEQPSLKKAIINEKGGALPSKQIGVPSSAACKYCQQWTQNEQHICDKCLRKHLQ